MVMDWKMYSLQAHWAMPASYTCRIRMAALQKSRKNHLDAFNDFEDVATLFFDYDHDGDPDLLICPGGNNSKPDSRQMQLRLFKNDGKGNFAIDVSCISQCRA
jgi:hypothetical protein